MKYLPKDYLEMKTPLSYQMSEFDCGPTSIQNAIRYILKRGQIYPSLIKGIWQYTLDTFGQNGRIGESGTSPQALVFISDWINNEMIKLGINICSKIIMGKEADIENKEVTQCINNGGVAVLRVWDDCQHYVLCTKIDEKCIYIFDPYYCKEDDFDDDTEVLMVTNKPFEYNRVVSKRRVKQDGKETFSMIKDKNQIIMLMY